MQFQVPQFIEFEDKIVGPLTLKQFGFLAIGAIACFLLFFSLTSAFAIMLSIPIMAIVLALAFVKIKGVPMPKYIVNFISFALKPQLYLWKK
jgi:hypothetical protein